MLKTIFFFISHMLPRLLINAYKMNILAYKHLIQMLYGFSPFLFLHPMTWPYAEIMMFTSLRACRNRGIGRKLMDAFLNEVKKGGIKNAYVGTDTSLSYYFYDSYGFTKVREFKMKAYGCSLPGETHRGLIYHISCRD